VRGLTFEERFLLMMRDDEKVRQSRLFKAMDALAACGRFTRHAGAGVGGNPRFIRTELGSLALRVCPVGDES